MKDGGEDFGMSPKEWSFPEMKMLFCFGYCNLGELVHFHVSTLCCSWMSQIQERLGLKIERNLDKVRSSVMKYR